MSDFFRKIRKTIKEIEKIADDFEEEIDYDETKNHYGRDTPHQLSTIDLRERLSLEELAHITGLPFDTYSDYLDEDWVGGVYTISDPSYHTYFQVWFARKDAEGYNSDGVIDYYKEVMPDLHIVQDIGDEAFWVDTKTLFILSGEDVIQASTNSDSELNLETMKTLVRKII